MTVNTTSTTSGPYTGNGVTADFSYTFRVEDKSQLIVYETQLTGTPVALTVDTDYTITGIGDDGGGTITRVAGALPTGYTWYITSNYAQTQLTDLDSQGGFFPDVHEAALDKLTFLIQQLDDGSNRSPRVSSSYSGDLPLLIDNPVAGKLIKWKGDLSGLENTDISELDSTLINDDQARFGFATVAEMIASTDATIMKVGRGLDIKEYSTGVNGGAVWDIVLLSTVVPNSYDIVACTGIPTLAAVLRQNPDGSISNTQMGVLPSPSGAKVDEQVGLTHFFNQARFPVLIVEGNAAGERLYSSKTIQTGAGKIIYWGEVVLESIVQVDLGAVLSFGANTTAYNPHVNGGGPSFIVGSSGQNGYGAIGQVTVYNPVADDCARGISTPFDGGKGFQSEGSSTDLTIFNMRAENCHMAVSSRKDGATGTGNHLKVYGIKAINCNHLSFSGQANVNSLDPQVYSVLITGGEAQNCGALDALPDADAGLFIGSRAANVNINNIFVSGVTKLEGMVRGRFRNSNINNITLTGDFLSIINLDPVPVIAVDTSVTENCQYDFKVNGTHDYLFLSDLTDSTHPNRFANNSHFKFSVKNDVTTSVVTAATRNGDSTLEVRSDDRFATHKASKWNSSFTTLTSLPSTNPDEYEEGTWLPTFSGTTGTIGTTAYSEQTGRYVKIGKMIFLNGFINISNLGSWTGNVRIGNLPFTSGASGFENQGSLEMRNVTFTQKYATVEIGRAGTSELAVMLIGSGVGAAQLPVTGLVVGSTFSFSIAYKIA